MNKTIFAALIILGLALFLVGISLLVYPRWLDIPGGVLIALGLALEAVAGLGSKIKDWRDLISGNDKKEKPSRPKAVPKRSQEMVRSEKGEQEMHGKGGIQEQKMSESPGGKQRMMD